jgi:uncharacterized Zn-binding protein involved in type VI secretion
MSVPRFVLSATALLLMIAGARAQAPAPRDTPAGGAPGVITEGSASVGIGGQAAARAGDRTDGSAVVGGSSNVFIGGRPAARVGDPDGCGGVVVSGSSNVFINGRPAARVGDATSGCAGK